MLPIKHIVISIGPVGVLGAINHGLPIYLCHVPPIILSGNLSPTVSSLYKGHFLTSKSLQERKLNLVSKTNKYRMLNISKTSSCWKQFINAIRVEGKWHQQGGAEVKMHLTGKVSRMRRRASCGRKTTCEKTPSNQCFPGKAKTGALEDPNN